MSVVRSSHFQLGVMFATALSCAVLPTAGQAYTPEEEQACSGDAFRLCGAEIPDVDRVTACMVRNKSALSPGCRAFFRPDEPEVTPVAAGKPVNIKPQTARQPVRAGPHKPKRPVRRGAA